MGWSFRLFRIGGVDVRVHFTVLLVLAIAASGWGGTRTPGRAAFGLAVAAGLFACVLLHELGHALTARAFGITAREVVLLPFGGVAMVGRLADRPLAELLVALAGPAVNLALALPLAALSAPVVGPAAADPQKLAALMSGPPGPTPFLLWMLATNVSLALFNLLPAFPLDGGRVLRAVLVPGLGLRRATRIATAIGQLLGVGLVVVGFATVNPLLLLVALFVFGGSARENGEVRARTALAGHPVGEFYNPQAATLVAGDPLRRAVELSLTTTQQEFPVLFGRQLLGVLTRRGVLAALARNTDEDIPVTALMERDLPRVEASEPLDAVRQRLADAGTSLAAVFREGEFLGLVGRDDIARVIAVLSARAPARVTPGDAGGTG